jgi:hypothetical protein
VNPTIRELETQRDFFATRCVQFAEEVARLNARIAEMSKPVEPAEPDPQP